MAKSLGSILNLLLTLCALCHSEYDHELSDVKNHHDYYSSDSGSSISVSGYDGYDMHHYSRSPVLTDKKTKMGTNPNTDCCEFTKGNVCFCRTVALTSGCACNHMISFSVIYHGDEALSHIKVSDTVSNHHRCKFEDIAPGAELICATDKFSDLTTFKLIKDDGSHYCTGYLDTSCKGATILDATPEGCDDIVVSEYIADDRSVCDNGLTPCICSDEYDNEPIFLNKDAKEENDILDHNDMLENDIRDPSPYSEIDLVDNIMEKESHPSAPELAEEADTKNKGAMNYDMNGNSMSGSHSISMSDSYSDSYSHSYSRPHHVMPLMRGAVAGLEDKDKTGDMHHGSGSYSSSYSHSMSDSYSNSMSNSYSDSMSSSYGLYSQHGPHTGDVIPLMRGVAIEDEHDADEDLLDIMDQDHNDNDMLENDIIMDNDMLDRDNNDNMKMAEQLILEDQDIDINNDGNMQSVQHGAIEDGREKSEDWKAPYLSLKNKKEVNKMHDDTLKVVYLVVAALIVNGLILFSYFVYRKRKRKNEYKEEVGSDSLEVIESLTL